MHRHVAAELERALQRRRGEGVVGDGARPGAMRDIGDGGDVDALDQRVRRGLDPDDPRRRLQRRGDVVGPRHVDEGRSDPPLREQVLQHVGGAVIDVARRDDMVARLQALEDRRHCGEPRAERGGGGAAFECGERGLEAVAVRIVVARIDEAVRIAAVSRALEGRREMDRVDHCAGGGVDAVAGVDGERFEAKGLGGLHVDATIPARRRRGGSDLGALTRAVACRKVYLLLSMAWKGAAVLHRASGFAIAPHERLAAASPARTGLQPRNDAAAGPAGFACAQSFPPKLLKPRRKLLPGASRRADVAPRRSGPSQRRDADLDWQR